MLVNIVRAIIKFVWKLLQIIKIYHWYKQYSVHCINTVQRTTNQNRMKFKTILFKLKIKGKATAAVVTVSKFPLSIVGKGCHREIARKDYDNCQR